MGWFPLYIHQYLSIARFWNRLLCMDDNRLTKAIFEADYAKNKKNWSSRALAVFNEHEVSQYFVHKLVLPLRQFQCLLETKYQAKWMSVVQSKPKLRTYADIKHNFAPENYVRYTMDKGERSFMAQLRCGILPLEIETGRYRKVQLQERLCFHCKHVIENELHFILTCPLYKNQRDILLTDVMASCNTFVHLDDIEKLQFLLDVFWKQTSKFITNIWKIRETAYYNSNV